MHKMIAVFCRECRKKLCDVTDINEGGQTRCPDCDSDYKFYHMIVQPSKGSAGMSTHTASLIRNKYDSVNIFIFDKLKQI